MTERTSSSAAQMTVSQDDRLPWPEQVAAGIPTDPCWHCDGTGRVGKCEHEWHDHVMRGIRLCWLCGRPEPLPDTDWKTNG